VSSRREAFGSNSGTGLSRGTNGRNAGGNPPSGAQTAGLFIRGETVEQGDRFPLDSSLVKVSRSLSFIKQEFYSTLTAARSANCFTGEMFPLTVAEDCPAITRASGLLEMGPITDAALPLLKWPSEGRRVRSAP